ncbi:MAG: hypothetical protein HKN87_18670 [Saprospiraceae bacterium]|nr:hypothetical protein [Saprospiraceae bacterium]
MKKIILALFSTVLLVGMGHAQVDLEGLDGKKALKKAKRALNAFNLDQTNSGDKLLEAKQLINYTTKQEGYKEDAEAWALMGQVYNAFSAYNQGQKVLNPDFQDIEPNGGMIAFQAYKKALELEPGEKSALDGLREAIGSISTTGLTAYEQTNYQESFNAFRSVLDIHKILKDNGAESPLDPEEEYDNQIYITAMAALNAGQKETAKSYVTQLYDKGYDKSSVYDAMYKLTADEDMEAAEEILNTARQKYPDDLGLLFTEINHYLKLQKTDVLEEKLKQAIEQEPENPSLYSTLGNVYDKLYQASYKDSSYDEAENYFALAMEYYGKAIEKKEDFTDAIYSLGALYYNKAALVTEEMNLLADDYSKEGTAKFNKKKEEVEELFQQALPHFKKVEMVDPNDRNSLIALKEIFARENNYEVSNAIKDRLEKVEAGETFSESYFKSQ